jgi:hypothetical protein
MADAVPIMHIDTKGKGKGKAFPLQAYGPRGFWGVKASRFRDIGT